MAPPYVNSVGVDGSAVCNPKSEAVVNGVGKNPSWLISSLSGKIISASTVIPKEPEALEPVI